MISASQQGRLVLELLFITGGWAMPEKGGLWRGKDQTRLHIDDRPFKNTDLIQRLHKLGYLEKLSATDMKAKVPETRMVPWFSPNRAVYKLTEAGEKHRLGYKEESVDNA